MSQFYTRVQAAVDRARAGDDANGDDEGLNFKKVFIYFCFVCCYFRFRVCARWGPVPCCV